MGPELVIFDCDGVLVDSEPVVTQVESELFGGLGFPMPASELQRRFQGMTVADVVAAVERALHRALTPEELYAWGIATASALVEELHAVPGVREVVQAVAASGARVCVASQSPLPRVRLSLAITGLAPLFGDHVFTASMVERPKPAPDLFLHAAMRMGVAPARSIVIEDSLSGVRAARAAGMHVYGYAAEHGAYPAEALAEAGAQVVRSMTELRAALRRAS